MADLTPTQREALRLLREHGSMHQVPGGDWSPREGGRHFLSKTIRTLVATGFAMHWRDGTIVARCQSKRDYQCTRPEGHHGNHCALEPSGGW